MYIRWLGAFHKSASNGISESIDFEMSRTSVAACEHLQKKNLGLYSATASSAFPGIWRGTGRNLHWYPKTWFLSCGHSKPG